MDNDTDPCASCKLPDVLDGPDPAAHWDSPFGTTIVAWTCSAECQAALEELRRPSGLLLLV
jgi:hypothetical protein